MLANRTLYAVIVDSRPEVVTSSVVAGEEVAAVGKAFSDDEPVPSGYILVQINQKRYAVWYDVTRPELRKIARELQSGASPAPVPERPSTLPVNSAVKRKTPAELAVVAASSAIGQSKVHHG